MAIFTADYPGSVIVPAHYTNWRQYLNHPKGFVLHTPEEAADDIEVTPYYFQNPNLDASTHYYLDNDGDVYQMVQEKFSAIANGVKGKPWPTWADPSINLNSQTINIEIEGRAASIGQTMPVGGKQFNSLVAWLKHRGAAYKIPLDREHIIGHYQVANDRSDPGATFPWTALMEALINEEDEMATQRVWCAERGQTWLLSGCVAVPVVSAADDAVFTKLYGPHAAVLTGAQLDAMVPR